MDDKYNLNDLAMMTGFTTRTLRNYLNQGLLEGEKENGVWQFTPEQLDRFFSEPFVKEGLRIKRSSAVFDFLAERDRKAARTCVILDLPADRRKGDAVSAFFCREMQKASDLNFSYGWDKGLARVILTGDAEAVAKILKAYYSAEIRE